MTHTRDSEIIISWPSSALATPFRFWIFPFLSSLFCFSWKMSKKGIMLNVYFNEHWDRNIFFSFFFWQGMNKYFPFYGILLMFISLSLQPFLTTREESFLSKNSCYPITLNYMYSLPDIVCCFLKLLLLFHYRNFLQYVYHDIFLSLQWLWKLGKVT